MEFTSEDRRFNAGVCGGIGLGFDIIKSVLLCAGSFGVVYFTKIHPILVIIAAGIIGYFIFI